MAVPWIELISYQYVTYVPIQMMSLTLLHDVQGISRLLKQSGLPLAR